MPKSAVSAIVPVILCGGSGTRLWPASREKFPKQFLALMGEHTLLQQTALRTMRTTGAKAADIVTVTLGDLSGHVAGQLAQIDAAAARHILCEPSARNTAAAVAFAACHVEALHGPNALMLVLPSDHHIADEKTLSDAFATGLKAAQSGLLVTFGIRPTRPETGYGYIRLGETIGTLPGVQRAAAFVEKPKLDVAKSYLADGNYLWNSGMFMFKAGKVLAEFERYSPQILARVREAIAAGEATARTPSFMPAFPVKPLTLPLWSAAPTWPWCPATRNGRTSARGKACGKSARKTLTKTSFKATPPPTPPMAVSCWPRASA